MLYDDMFNVMEEILTDLVSSVARGSVNDDGITDVLSDLVDFLDDTSAPIDMFQSELGDKFDINIHSYLQGFVDLYKYSSDPKKKDIGRRLEWRLT